MKKLISLMLCLAFIVPCAFAEELPRSIGENDADYAWMNELSLIVAERFQYGLDCTWHSFLLSAANVPEQEMIDALAPLREQDYNQPVGMTIVRADQIVPDEMIEAWQEALKAEEEAKAARAALRSAELVNELAIVKLANAEEAALKTAEEALRASEEALKAAEEVVRLAQEAVEALRMQKRGEDEETKAAEETAAIAEEIARLAEETLKAVEEAARAGKESDKGEAFLAAKEAAKAAQKANKAVEDAIKAAEEAAKAAEDEEGEEGEGEAPEKKSARPAEKKEKTELELAEEEATYRIADAVIATEKASKAAEEAFKAQANAIQAAQTLADLQAGKLPGNEETDADLEFSDEPAFSDDEEDGGDADPESDGESDDWDLDWDAPEEPEKPENDGLDWNLDWDDPDSDLDWELEWDYGSGADASEEAKRLWFIEEDPERDLYESAPTILNFHEEDKMFSGISSAIQVRGFYTRGEPLDGPCCAVVDYDGVYSLLITYYPAGEGFVSISCQVIYARSADKLIMP